MNTTQPALAADTASPQAALPAQRQHGLGELAAWAETARAAFTVAESLAKTSFVPAAYRGKPHEVTAAILTGAEMGLSPMAALRSFDLIQGTPAMRANAMRGLVQSHGHAVWEEESTPERAVVCGRRAATGEVHRSEWTIERARGLQLTGKDNWKKQPQAMLLARATAEACRLTASDVLHGVPYAAEELADGTPSPTRVVRRRRKPTQDEAPTEHRDTPPHQDTDPPHAQDDNGPDAGGEAADAPLWGETATEAE